jgi:hypothetical protein
MTANRRREILQEAAQHSAVVVIVLALELLATIGSTKSIASHLVDALDVLALYAVVISTVKLRYERVAMALAILAALAVFPLALVAMMHHKFLDAAILTAVVVLAARVYGAQ